ncbi:MAG: pyridoxamine 5'-phosphate oxidase family protein [Dehalococcoidia bacterium]
MLSQEPFEDLFSALDQKPVRAWRVHEPLLPLAGTGVVATMNEDGTPLQSEAAVFYDGQSYYLTMNAGAPELDNLRRNPRLSMYIRNPLNVCEQIVVRGSAVERRVQPSYHLVYVRIAPDPDNEPASSDAGA